MRNSLEWRDRTWMERGIRSLREEVGKRGCRVDSDVRACAPCPGTYSHSGLPKQSALALATLGQRLIPVSYPRPFQQAHLLVCASSLQGRPSIKCYSRVLPVFFSPWSKTSKAECENKMRRIIFWSQSIVLHYHPLITDHCVKRDHPLKGHCIFILFFF